MPSFDSVWTGAVDGDWGTAGNWTGAVPLAGERALIADNTTAIDGSDQSAADLALVVVDEAYDKTIGSDGSPIILASNRVVLRGSGAVFIKADGAGIDDLVIDCPTNQIAVNVDANLTDLTNLHILRGNVTINGAAGTIALVKVKYRSNRDSDVILTVSSGITAITTLEQDGGRVTSSGAITTARLRGGRLVQGTATITTIDADGGAHVEFNFGGTIATAYIGRATLDLLRSPDAKTITTLWQYPGAVVQMDPEIVTVTNDRDQRGRAA